jgi:hypothetical protein
MLTFLSVVTIFSGVLKFYKKTVIYKYEVASVCLSAYHNSSMGGRREKPIGRPKFT